MGVAGDAAVAAATVAARGAYERCRVFRMVSKAGRGDSSYGLFAFGSLFSFGSVDHRAFDSLSIAQSTHASICPWAVKEYAWESRSLTTHCLAMSDFMPA